MSRCVGLTTLDPKAAAEFYQAVFGFCVLREGPSLQLGAGPLRLFLDPGPPHQPIFELETSDLPNARRRTRSFGFEEIAWHGAGRPCLLRDPFGLTFNVHVPAEEDQWNPFELQDDGWVRECLGAVTTAPVEVAEFYAKVLEAPLGHSNTNDGIVESAGVRLRFRFGNTTRPLLWLKSDAPIARLASQGCDWAGDGLLEDPYGLTWGWQEAAVSARAVVRA